MIVRHRSYAISVSSYLMTDTLPSHRSLTDIAAEIQHAWIGNIPRDLRVCLYALQQLTRVDDELSYRTVANLRNVLGRWRTPAARRIKGELEVFLAHYRADQ